MMQPRQDFGNINRLFAGGKIRPVYHHNWDVQSACRQQFGASAVATGVFGNDTADAVCAHQRQIILSRKRPTINHRNMVGEGQRHAWRINEAQQIEVLRVWRKLAQVHTPHGQHDAFVGYIQGGNRGRDIRHIDPVVALLDLPRRARKGDQRDVHRLARLNRIAAHLGGKGMGGIDQMRYGIVTDILDQALDTAETANALWQRVAGRARNTARQRNSARLSRLAERFAQGGRLGCTAKDQGVWAHG